MRFPRPTRGERPPPDERVDRPEVEAPRGAREPTGTNGPTPHQPPQTTKPGGQRHHDNPRPQAHNGPTGPTRGRRRNHYTNHDQPTPHPAPPHNSGGGQQEAPPHSGPTRGDGRHNLVVVTAPGKRPATFRTWKLSPAAPMVLHPRGCGRVGNRHNTPEGGPRTQARPPTHTHPNTHTRAHAPPRTHARNHTRQTSTHAREEYRTHAHNTTTQNQPSSTRRLVWT